MRKWCAGAVLGFLLGTLLLGVVEAQTYIWGSINGVPVGTRMGLSGGTYSAPSLFFTNDTNYDTGLFSTAATDVEIVINGSRQHWFEAGAYKIGGDLIFTRENAAILQMGADAAGTTAQMIKGPDRITSSGVGGALYLAGGRGYDTGIGGDVIIQTAPSAGAGAAGTLTTRALFTADGDLIMDTSSAGGGTGVIKAGTYWSGGTIGADCTSAAAVTTKKGIVTACSEPAPEMTPQALYQELQAVKQELATLRASLGLR